MNLLQNRVRYITGDLELGSSVIDLSRGEDARALENNRHRRDILLRRTVVGEFHVGNHRLRCMCIVPWVEPFIAQDGSFEFKNSTNINVDSFQVWNDSRCSVGLRRFVPRLVLLAPLTRFVVCRGGVVIVHLVKGVEIVHVMVRKYRFVLGSY